MTRLAPHCGSPGRPAVFSGAAIRFCLTIKILFKLPLRQTTGIVASLLKMTSLDWAYRSTDEPLCPQTPSTPPGHLFSSTVEKRTNVSIWFA